MNWLEDLPPETEMAKLFRTAAEALYLIASWSSTASTNKITVGDYAAMMADISADTRLT